MRCSIKFQYVGLQFPAVVILDFDYGPQEG
jgi:hypothetical protein